MQNEKPPLPHWLKPPIVSAPDASDFKKSVNYAISRYFFDSMGNVFRRSPLFQIWTHVVGELPPINNVSRLLRGSLTPTISTLRDAVAVFQGVRRPYDDEENGHSVLVYVLNPSVTIDYELDLACLAKAVKVPKNVALTVQVKPTSSLQIPGSVNIEGTVTRLEFVSGSGGKLILPEDHSDRYDRILWRREP